MPPRSPASATSGWPSPIVLSPGLIRMALGLRERQARHRAAETVKTHVRHLYRKLGVHSRHEAVQRARAIGLLTGSCRRS